MLSGEWLSVGSSNVSAIRYLHDEQILEVEFLSGDFYDYFHVPNEVAKAMAGTSSPGRFVWSFLRDVYDYALILKGDKKPKGRYPRNASVIRTRREIETEHHKPSMYPKHGGRVAPLPGLRNATVRGR